MPDNGATFNEVLSVQVNVDTFRAGLQLLEQEYRAFLDRLPTGSSDTLLGAGALGGIQGQLNSLIQNFTVVQDAMAALSNTVVDQFSRMQAKVVTTSKEMADQVVEFTDEAGNKIISDDMAGMEKRARAYAQFLEQRKEADMRYDIGQQNFQEKAAAAEVAVEEKAAADIAAILQRRDVELATMRGKQMSAEEKAAAGVVGIQQKRDVELASLRGKRMAEEDKAAADAVKIAEKAAADIIAIQQKRDVELAVIRGKRLAEEEKAARQTAQVQQEALKNPTAGTGLPPFAQKQIFDSALQEHLEESASPISSIQRAMGSLLTDIPEAVGGLIKFQITWAAASAIVSALVAPVLAISNGIKEGWEYSVKLQETSAQFQGVLAANVKFATDMGTNFQMAGQFATVAVQKLQQMSIETGISVEQLQSAFKALVEGGGANFVTQFSELPRLAELFAVAVQATGKDFMVQRTLISEIPGLLDGSITKSSKILETLHMTQDQWEKIRQSGLAHHDLLAQLEPVLSPYLTVLQQADLRMQVMNEKWDLLKKQIFAAIDAPIFAAFLSFLQKAAGWLDEHKAALIAIGVNIMNLVKDFGSLADTFLRVTGLGSVIITTFNAAAGATTLLVGGLRLIANLLEFTLNSLHIFATAMVDMFSNPSKLISKDAWLKLLNDLADEAAKAKEKLMNSAADTVDALTGGTPTQTQDAAVSGQHNVTAKAVNDLKQLEAEWREATDAVKTHFDTQRREAKQAFDEGKISALAYHEAVSDNLKVELHNLEALNELYKGLFGKSGAKPAAIKLADTRVDDTQIKEDASITNTRDANEHTFQQFKIKLAQEESKEELALSKANLAEKLKDYQLLGNQQKGVKARLDAEAREIEFQEQLQTLRQEEQAEGTSELRRASLRAQIKRTEMQQEAALQRSVDAIAKADLDDAIARMKVQLAIDKERIAIESERVALDNRHEMNQQKVFNNVKKTLEEEKQLLATDAARVDFLITEAMLLAAQTGDTQKLLELEKERARLAKEQLDNQKQIDKHNQQNNPLATIFGSTANSDGSSSDPTNLKDAFSSFGSSVNSLNNAFQFFSGAVKSLVNAWSQGKQQGGVLGGIGGLLGAGGQIASKFGPMGQLVGGVMELAGSVLSTIGSIFTAAAKHIADEIKKSFDKTVQNLQDGTINLQTAIQQIEQQRMDAIARLSGKKGGKDQLAQLLPELDKELASLKQQQKQVFDSFEQQLAVLKLQSDTLGSVLTTWTNINKQITDYVNAGGDAQKAADMLSLTLQKLQKDANANLRDANQQAIQDALKLNDLLTQRVQLGKDYANTIFGLESADSIERRSAGAVTRGQQAAQATSDYKKNLTDLTQQIDLQKQTVTKEGTLFNLAQSISDLHRQDDALTLQALDEQIAKWKDIQAVAQGIVPGANGSYSLSDSLRNSLGLPAASGGTNIGTVNVNVDNGGNPVDGRQIASDFQDEMDRRNYTGGNAYYSY
jgi:hypothetical protein